MVTVDRDRLLARAHVRRTAGDPRGRLPDRAAARLGRAGSGSSPRAAGSARSTASTGTVADPLPSPARRSSTRCRHRRDRRRVHRHRPRAATASTADATGAPRSAGAGVRPRHAAEARPALTGLRHHADAASGSDLVAITDNADPRMNVVFYDGAPADSGPAALLGAGVRRGRERDGEQPGRGGSIGDRREQLRLRRPASRRCSAGPPRPGVARVDVDRRQLRGRVDQHEVVAPTSVPKVVAGQRPALRLHQAGRRPRSTALVLHRDRRPHRRHRLAAG